MAPTSSETRSPAGEAEMHHRPIAHAQACRKVRRIQDRAHLLHRQVTDELLIVTLDGDGVDLTDLLQSGRHLVFDIAHERFDRGKTQIAGGGSIAALALDVTKEVQDQWRIELLDMQLRRLCPDALGGEGEQEPEAVRIGLAAMRAIAPLAGHVVAQEAGDRAEQGAVMRPPP